MQDALMLFKFIFNSWQFTNTGLVLLLNKIGLLKAKLEASPISKGGLTQSYIAISVIRCL